MITFVVDELRLTTPLAELFPEFLGLSGTITELKKYEFCKAYVTASAWQTKIVGDIELYEILFTRGHLDADVRDILMRQFEKLTPLELPTDTSTRDYVVSQVKKSMPAATIVIPSAAGPIAHHGAVLHQVGLSEHVLEFFKDVPDIGSFPEASFMEFAASIFPSLFFQKDLAAQIKTLPNVFGAGQRRKLMNALAGLNDVLPRLLAQGIQQELLGQVFQAECHFEISIESKNTRKSARLMRKRDAVLGKQTLRCEWHLKLEPTRGRIHFYFGPDLVGEHADKVFVGIFCEHL
jgi:hypothetical protein